MNELRKHKALCDMELISSDRLVFPLHQVVFTALNQRHFNLAIQNAETGVFDMVSKKRMMFSSVESGEMRIFISFMYGQQVTDNKR